MSLKFSKTLAAFCAQTALARQPNLRVCTTHSRCVLSTARSLCTTRILASGRHAERGHRPVVDVHYADIALKICSPGFTTLRPHKPEHPFSSQAWTIEHVCVGTTRWSCRLLHMHSQPVALLCCSARCCCCFRCWRFAFRSSEPDVAPQHTLTDGRKKVHNHLTTPTYELCNAIALPPPPPTDCRSDINTPLRVLGSTAWKAVRVQKGRSFVPTKARGGLCYFHHVG